MIEALRRALKTRVTLATLAILLFSIWALGYFAARMLLRDMERLVGEQQLSTASLVAENVNDEMKTRMTALERLADRIDKTILDKHGLLQADLENRAVIQVLFNGGFFITDAAGTATASFPLSANRAGVNDMFGNHVAGALREGKPTISDIVIGRQLQVPAMSLAVPIRDARGQVVGSLVGVIHLSTGNFLDKITAAPYGRTGGYLIISRKQRLVIAATDRNRVMETLPSRGADSLLDRLIEGFEGPAVLVDARGVEVLTSAKGVPMTGWAVASSLPTAEAFAPVRGMERRMLFATLVLALLAGGITWVVLRRRLVPVEVAASAIAAQPGPGMAPDPRPKTTQDEVGQLVDGFNQLLVTSREHEARLGAIAAITSDLVYSCYRGGDGPYRFDWMSGNAEPLFGVKTDELTAKGCWRPFVVEQDQPLFSRAITDLRPGHSSEQVLRIARPDGSVRWLQSTARAEIDPADGARHRLVGALRDITERIEGEQERLRLASILEATSDIVSMADSHGKILYMNKPGRALIGVSPEASPGRIPDVHPRWALDIVLGEGVPTAIRNGVWSGETAVLGADGEEIPVSQVILSHKDSAGNLLFLSTIMRDIRAIRAAHGALRAGEARYRELFESNPHPMWVYDLDTLRFLAVNDSAIRHYGYSREEFLGMTIKDIRPPEDVSRLLDNVAKVTRGLDEAGTLRHRTRDGRVIDVEITSHTLDFDGRSAELVLADDVTRRLAAERALRDSESRLREAQRMAHIGHWTLDLPNGPLHWSDEIFRIFEIDPERFQASYGTLLDCVHPDDRAAVDAAYRSALSTREPYSIVHRLLFPDGRIKHVHERGENDYGPDGAPLRSRGTVQDVTERVLAEQERERLAAILEATTDIVSMADSQGKLIYLNGPGRALLGIAPDGELPEAIPRVHPRWASEIVLGTGLPTAIREGTWSGETAVLGPGGEEIPVSQLILRHQDKQGNLLFLSTIMRDIRASRAASHALRDSEERLRLALTAASQGLWDLDLVTGEAKVSPEYATMLGYDPATFRETNAAWRERLHPDDEASVFGAFEDYVAGRLPEYRVEFRQRMPDGGWKWVLSLGRIQARSADGRPLRMLGTHTDIDAIKAAEAALRELNVNLENRVAERTAELTAANRELESFAYAVSHDLRAPLRAMSGFAWALQEDYGATLQGDAKTYLEQIVNGSRKMSDLIDGLLTLSRSTRGDLRHDRVDVSALARRRLTELAAADPGRRVASEVENGLVLQGDERMFAVAVTNLIDNAWKYTGATAAAAIRVYAGEVDGHRGICVSDNGAGFDMDHTARLFQPFQRLHRQDEFPGIGIGLATVQRIVHRHGGVVVARAAPGRGATFCIAMPESSGGSDKESST